MLEVAISPKYLRTKIFQPKMNSRHTRASDYYFVTDEKGRRLYYSRITHKRVARRKIDPSYVNEILDRNEDPLSTAKRLGGTWYADDETGKITHLVPPNYDPVKWFHTFHAFAGREDAYAHPFVVDLDNPYARGNGYVFASISEKDVWHRDGMEILMNQYRLAQKHVSGG